MKYIFRSIILRNKLEYIEVHIVDNCNLNCKGCSLFSNISKEKNFIDARMLGIRLRRLNKLFTIKTISLLGGEPLLHPDIINILKIARRNLPFSQIQVLTNGTLLNKMSQEFFETCYEKNIKISITTYSVLNNTEELKKIFSSFKIKYEFSPMIFTFSANLNPYGNSNQEETFKNCRYNYCKILREDNIYLCSRRAYLDKYNEYFNKNIPMGKGINIFNNSAKQIFNYLKTPEETCKYCTNVKKYIDWSCSDKPKETDWYGKI